MVSDAKVVVVSDDKVVVTVKTTSVANGQKFEHEFLEFELDKYDEIGDVRTKLCMRLHDADGANFEEAQEYTEKVAIKMVAIIDTKPKILGSFKSIDNNMTVADFLDKYELVDDWYFQMPMSTKFGGGGT